VFINNSSIRSGSINSYIYVYNLLSHHGCDIRYQGPALSESGYGPDGRGVHKEQQRGIQEESSLGASSKEGHVPDLQHHIELSLRFRKDRLRQEREDRLDMESGTRQKISIRRGLDDQIGMLSWYPEWSLRMRG